MSEYLDNYSPFEDNEEPLKPVTNPVPPSPIATPKISSTINSNEVTEEQLAQYEEQLNLLEHSLNKQELEITQARQTGSNDPAPNWPYCYPIVHFDIEEVEPANRGMVHSAFFSWIVMAISFALNWIGTLTLLSVKEGVDSPGSKIALSSLYLFIVVPLAIDLDALSIYKALSTNAGTFSFIKIFLSVGITCLFETILAIGLDSSGSVGLITTINLFTNKNIGTGVFGVAVTIFLAASAILHFRLLTQIWNYYRGTEQGNNMETDVKRSVANFVVESLK
ncbi:scamp-domain-containing protein [Histomonas meleagridis]|uniref:scamp-domain-containing protein n=1 Tax=Histomonas meleagridis TaxID=135588 RepID=UPI0035596329|nr:scamp-domain-containing protein [Histomonas meleagridis]KAH0798385.1 scamp-domain-containing protein [Histomonas meleagridis]